MVILTIKFPKGAKTYDYLLRNPDRLKIDRGKPLKMLIGVYYGRSCFQELTLINAQKVEVLPSHVTSSMLLMPDNEVRTCRLSMDTIKTLSRTITKSINTEITRVEQKASIPSRPDPNWSLSERLRWAVKRYKI